VATTGARRMNLLPRVASAAVLIAVVVGALVAGGHVLEAVAAAAGLIGAYELFTIIQRVPPLRYPGPRAVLAWLVGCAYVAAGLTALVAIDRYRGGDAVFNLRLIAVVLGAVIACDTCAYFVGFAVGRHPFFPKISPKKTAEGAAGGLAGAVIVVLAAGVPVIGLGIAQAVALGLLIAVAAQGGDLLESALKRRAGVKDSSGLIPGHGGLLDRLDSLLLVGPIVYLTLRAFAVA
jgi:CDP-diglyceride synthetase